MTTVPKSLRVWFIVHFIVDMIFAIPLLFFTSNFLTLFNLPPDNLVLARLVSAAMIGIGGTSLLMHKKGVEAFQTMLTLKLVWSGCAILAIIISLQEIQFSILLPILITFIAFFIVWAYYFRKLNKG